MSTLIQLSSGIDCVACGVVGAAHVEWIVVQANQVWWTRAQRTFKGTECLPCLHTSVLSMARACPVEACCVSGLGSLRGINTPCHCPVCGGSCRGSAIPARQQPQGVRAAGLPPHSRPPAPRGRAAGSAPAWSGECGTWASGRGWRHCRQPWRAGEHSSRHLESSKRYPPALACSRSLQSTHPCTQQQGPVHVSRPSSADACAFVRRVPSTPAHRWVARKSLARSSACSCTRRPAWA